MPIVPSTLAATGIFSPAIMVTTKKKAKGVDYYQAIPLKIEMGRKTILINTVEDERGVG